MIAVSGGQWLLAVELSGPAVKQTANGTLLSVVMATTSAVSYF